MSKDFDTALILNDTLHVTPEITYGVKKGGQSVVWTPYRAMSASTSSHVFNLQLPSQLVVCSRRMLWRCTTKLAVTVYNNITTVPASTKTALQLLGYGVNTADVNSSCLAPFPNHSCLNTMTSTINSTTVNLNVRDVLPSMLRFYDKRELSRYNGTAPVQYDSYGKYADSISAINSPFGGFENAIDNDILPRGAFVVKLFQTDGITPLTNSITVATGASYTLVLEYTSTEPVMLSPWMWNKMGGANSQGMYGISVINNVFNVGTPNRVLRTTAKTVPVGTAQGSINFAGTNNVALSVAYYGNGFFDSTLLVNFITPHPSLLMSPKNVVPYMEMPRYITQVGTELQVPADKNATVAITSNSLQLNVVPDYVILQVRKVISQQTNSDADCFLPIRGVTMQYNAQAGILSSASTEELFNMSCRNGSNQNWQEFYGYASKANADTSGAVTSGSCLILSFGNDINLTNEYEAPGVLGSYNFQVTLNVHNNTGAIINANEYELVIITVNSGIFVNERGSSQNFISILGKQDVLSASDMKPYSGLDARRMVGGGFMDSLGQFASKVKSIAQPLGSVAKAVLSHSEDPRAQAASALLGTLGAGASGGRREIRDRRI